jgi:hypothetical protein
MLTPITATLTASRNLFGGGVDLLFEQVLANAVTIVYSFLVTFAIMKALAVTMGIRVAADTEDTGLDLAEHGETAYTTGDALLGTTSGGSLATPTSTGGVAEGNVTNVQAPIDTGQP